jgi:SAM-dependent methyltransferase
MEISCNVCGSKLKDPVYQSSDNRSITSLAQIVSGHTSVYFCDSCTHLTTTELPDINEYYANQYQLNTNSDDEDQLYEVINNIPVYRTDKQAELFLQKVRIPKKANILDYGCGKAATMKKISQRVEGIIPHLFDVTDNHRDFWLKFIESDNMSFFNLPDEWNAKFNVITSFYAIEHIPDLEQCMKSIYNMLGDKGTLYFMVPNTYDNIADLIVADHVNHFSRESLECLLTRHRFTNIEIDNSSFTAAFIVKATKTDIEQTNWLPGVTAIKNCKEKAISCAIFWNDIISKINTFEQEADSGGKVAIYGAGFYGRFIVSCLNRPTTICCFIDQNKHLQGTTVLDIPVLSAEDCPAEIKTIYVGLNPANAKSIIYNVKSINWTQKKVFFL